MKTEQELELGVSKLKLNLDSGAQIKLQNYLELLKKWNKVYNLTAVRETEQMISHHVLDSLAVLPHLWPGRWLDVGSGAGLPGLVLAIAQPDWQFTLLDSNSKKTSFLQQAVIELDLHNVRVYCTRVEKLDPKEKFDGIISRAFADTTDFVKLTAHLLKQNGKWAAMKGTPDQELQHLPSNIIVEQNIPLSVPGINAKRCLVILKAI